MPPVRSAWAVEVSKFASVCEHLTVGGFGVCFINLIE